MGEEGARQGQRAQSRAPPNTGSVVYACNAKARCRASKPTDHGGKSPASDVTAP